MKKIIAMLMALTLIGGSFTGCFEEKEKSSEKSKDDSSVADTSKSDEDSDDDDDKSAEDDSVDAEKVDNYSSGYGLTLCDEESIVPIQGSIVDIAMGYDVLCLTKDEKVVSIEDDMIAADAPDGVRFVDDTVGYGAIVERADGTCMYFDDFYESIVLRCEGFEMKNDSYFETLGDMMYISSDGEKLLGYYYDYDMNLVADGIPVVIEHSNIEIADWCSKELNKFLLLDVNNQVWTPTSPAGAMQMSYDKDGNFIEIGVWDDAPELSDCDSMCYMSVLDDCLVITKVGDTSNLYVMTEGDNGYEESGTIALPDGLKTTDIKEYVTNYSYSLFITNSNEIYTIEDNTAVKEPELSQLMQEGKIIEIIGDGFDTLFLMDDGCVYEK